MRLVQYAVTLLVTGVVALLFAVLFRLVLPWWLATALGAMSVNAILMVVAGDEP
jgi:hypothetical protein